MIYRRVWQTLAWRSRDSSLGRFWVPHVLRRCLGWSTFSNWGAR